MMSNGVQRTLKLVPLLAALVVSYIGAFLLRFEFTIPNSEEWSFFIGLCIFVLVKGPVLWAGRLHVDSWRTASLYDLHRVAMANIGASGLACLLTAVIVGPAFPRSVYFIDAALCFLTTASVVFSVRLYREIFVPEEGAGSKRVLIYGAGTAGCLLGREILAHPALKMSIAGFLDDDERKQDTSLLGVEILGTGRDARALVARFARARQPISEIIIALPSASGRQMQAVTAHCRTAEVPFKTLPGVAELLDGGKMTRQIREVSANDLLGREPVRIDTRKIAEGIAGESILVTGGCGSIGSELCRQIAQFKPRKLVIFDQAESEMFMLALELRKRYPQLNLVTEIGDIYRASRVERVVAGHGIASVFHAAAYKHVPLMEENILEAVENNVIGTYNVARCAHRNGVKKFVLISSDKAVNPTSIMGLTKRVAELIVSAMPLDGSRRSCVYAAVRFGNVLGSSGSVIPIFQRQIAAGGPITVTHPEMRRYFMSISEAVQLVLQASTMGQGSDIFVLDMGEPVKIMTLARNMIHLAGLTPGEDIQIAVTGLRPGEKLFEEIQLDGESVLPTQHEKILRLRSQGPGSEAMAGWLDTLQELLKTADARAVKAYMKRLVPEYQGDRAIPDREAVEDLEVAAQA